MSAEKPTVIEALVKVMADVQAVGKDKTNTQQNYKFRGIDAVVNAVGPALRAHSVIVVPAAVETHYRDVQTSTGKPSRECTVTVTYRFYGPAGDFIDAQVPGESMDFGDKGAPKAMSVAFRIALLQALCIPTDEPDPDAQTYERAQSTSPRDEPSVARAELAGLCGERGWSTAEIADLFIGWDADHRPLPQADAATVREFAEKLLNGEVAP